MKINSILFLCIFFINNLNAGQIDIRRPYRISTLALQNAILKHKDINGIFAANTLTVSSVDLQTDLAKESTYLTSKTSKDVAQKNDLLILKNENLNLGNEMLLTIIKSKL